MFNKITASAAVLAIAAISLTGCSSKLSTEETCKFIEDQVIEKNLNKVMEDASTDLMRGKTEPYMAAAKQLNAVFDEAGSKTKDEQFRETLASAVKQNNEIAAVYAESNPDPYAEMKKIDELSDTEEYRKASEYMGTACESTTEK